MAENKVEVVLKKIATSLALTVILASCGAPTESKTIEEIVPQGFTVSAKKETAEGDQFVIAKNSQSFVLMVAEPNSNGFRPTKKSAPFQAKLVEFAPDELWPVKLSADAIGYSLSFEVGEAAEFEGKFIKVFIGGYSEVTNDLGPGFVPRDLQDYDYDGTVELVCIDARWKSLKQFTVAQPFTQKICVFREGVFKDETSGFTEHLKAGEKRFSQNLAGSVTQEEILYNAMNLLLIFESMDKLDEGLAGFAETLKHLKDPRLNQKASELLALFRKQAKNGEKLSPPEAPNQKTPAWGQVVWEK